jgi:hypothetical protein
MYSLLPAPTHAEIKPPQLYVTVRGPDRNQTQGTPREAFRVHCVQVDTKGAAKQQELQSPIKTLYVPRVRA